MTKSLRIDGTIDGAANGANGLNGSNGSTPDAKKKVKPKMFKEVRVFFAFPHLFLSIVFVVIPLFLVLIYALKSEGGGFTLSNFKVFAEPDTWRTIGDSFLMAFLTTLICFALCYPLALALVRVKTNKTAILVMMFVLPMWINSLLRILAIKFLLEELVGLGFWLTLIGMVYDFLPFMLLPIYTVIVNTDRSYLEAAGDLGASPLKSLIKVRVPLSVPGIISGVLMVFMPTMSTFAISDFLGGTDIPMLGNLIARWFKTEAGYGIGSAYSLVLMALIGVSVLVANFLSKGKAKASGGII